MQKEFKEAIFEFIKQVSNLEEINSIVLFGSVAKEEAKTDSDIDILIVVSDLKIEKKILEISRNVEDGFNRKFQILVKTKKLEDLDPSTIGNIASEGVLLYGVPIKVKNKDLELEPYSVAVYSLSHLPQSEKMKFKRSLFGSVSVFERKSKRYETLQEGLLKNFSGAKLGRGAIIFPSKYKEITKQLEYFKVRYRVFTVFGNKNLIDWINSFHGG